jgi:SAM-dependent methyltransferase
MAFEELKRKQSAVWGSAPYEPIVDITAAIHERLVETESPRPGERWLDVATGTGAVALLSARAGAVVTGLDLAPELIDTARRRAAEQGLEVRFDVGDAENLPYDHASFDVVVSAIGIMFAPDHAAVAHELSRVCSPDGRLGLASWTPDSGVAEMFRVMGPFQPPAVPGVGNPFEWGDEQHVRALLDDSFELEFRREDTTLEIESGEAAWQLFVTAYGPTKTLYDSLDEERREELQREFVALYERHRVNGGIRQPRGYLLVHGSRR